MDTPPIHDVPFLDVPLWTLFATLVLLVFLSAFFSASETAMMSLNRYRLRHRADAGDHRARVALRLLRQPDRLLSTILLGNNLANMAAASVATVIALRLFGEYAIAIATFVMTMLILVLAEVPPKTLAAMFPERIAYPVAPLLYRLQWLCRPLILLVNVVGNALLLRVQPGSARHSGARLSASELRSAVIESGNLIPRAHRTMLLRILDLEGITVDDVMVSRAGIEAIDIGDEREEVLKQIRTSRHAHVPVYRKNLDQVIGILNLRKVLLLLDEDENLQPQALIDSLDLPYFIPEGASLTDQFLQLQQQHHRMGLVVDEYGDIKGLITVAELLEEIVGEFTDNAAGSPEGIHRCKDGSWTIDGSATIRDINRKLDWELPTDGPKTMNGLILEHLEQIPPRGFTLKIKDRPIEITRTQGTAVLLTHVGHPVTAKKEAEHERQNTEE